MAKKGEKIMDEWDSVSNETPPGSTMDARDAVSTPEPSAQAPRRRMLPPDNLIIPDASQPDDVPDQDIPTVQPLPASPPQDSTATSHSQPDRIPPVLPRRSRVPVPALLVKRPALIIVSIAIALMLVIGGLGAFYVVNTHVISFSAPVHKNYPSDADLLYSQVTNERPTFSDPLVDNRNNWDVSSGSCGFTGGTYHATANSIGKWIFCSCSYLNNLNNFALQVQMSLPNSDDGEGGIFFGANNNGAYRTLINFYGYYVLYSQTKTLDTNSDFDPAIKQGDNVMTIIVNNNIFYLYLNGKFIVNTNLATYSQYSPGNVGLVAGSTYGAADVAFNNLKEWAL